MDDEEVEKKRKRRKHLHDLGAQCRVLSVITLMSFSICSVILIITCIQTVGQFKAQDIDVEDNTTLLITLTVFAVLGVLVSILLLISTCNKHPFLVIPYWMCILALFIQYLYILFYFGLCIGKCKPVTEIHNNLTVDPNRPSPYTEHILKGSGGSYIFSSLLVLPLLTYVLLPTYGFFMECCAKRAEEQKKKKEAEKRKQQQQQQQGPPAPIAPAAPAAPAAPVPGPVPAPT